MQFIVNTSFAELECFSDEFIVEFVIEFVVEQIGGYKYSLYNIVCY